MKINPQRVFKFQHDPSHGWLSVPVVYLLDVCFTDELQQITNYSYARGKSVYLEEDHDAEIFITAWKRKYQNFNCKHSYTESRHPIRSYVSLDDDLKQQLFVR